MQEDLGLPETTYELCYNAACTLIGQGQLTEAMAKLEKAAGKRSHTVSCFKCPSILQLANDSARPRMLLVRFAVAIICY